MATENKPAPLASEIIKEDGLTEPHVIFGIGKCGYDLVRLRDILKWMAKIVLDPSTIHSLRATTLAHNGAITEHISKMNLGDIVHFEILPNGNIRSYQDVPNEILRQAIGTLVTKFGNAWQRKAPVQ